LFDDDDLLVLSRKYNPIWAMEAYRYINGENEMLQRAKIEFGAGGAAETKRMGIEVSNRGFAFIDFMGSIVPIDEFENIPFRFVSFRFVSFRFLFRVASVCSRHCNLRGGEREWTLRSILLLSWGCSTVLKRRIGSRRIFGCA